MVVMIASASLRAAAYGCRQKVAVSSVTSGKRMASAAVSVASSQQNRAGTALAAAGGLAAALVVVTTVGRDNEGKVSD
jgi:hypothetical protein